MASLTEFNKRMVGNGLIKPLRRLSGNDFLSATGPALIKSAIQQILGTRTGELPWRPAFGTNLESYRHRSMTEPQLQSLIATIQTALTIWEPRLSVTSVTAESEENKIRVRIVWTINVGATITGNNIFHSSENVTDVEV